MKGVEAFNFIFITFPGGDKSIMRMGCFREIFDKEVKNAVAISYDFWKLEESKQIDLILSYCDKDKDNILLFVPGAKFKKFIPQQTIERLKGIEDIQSIICYLTDGIERQAVNMGISINECNKLFDVFDVVYSYDIYESEKYGFIYEPLPLKKFEIEVANPKSSKLFFCGRAKGRLHLLYDIANLCEENNVEYEFLVLRDSETEGLDGKGKIQFVEYIQYDHLVDKIASSTCLLSLVAKNNNMTSASYNEAIMYNKKLITNCTFLSENKYYNPNFMKSFLQIDEIDFEWIKDKSIIDYKYSGYFSVKKLLQHIANDYDRGLLRKCSKFNHILSRQRNGIKIAVHYSRAGWVNIISKNAICTENQIEAIRIYNIPESVKVTLETISCKSGFIKSIYKNNCVECGTTGKSDPIFSFRIFFENNLGTYEALYRGYIKNQGWTRWYSSGEWCGTNSKKMFLNGLQIYLIV